MAHFGVNYAYEVALGPAAIRIVLGLPNPVRREVAHALGTELVNGPNASIAANFEYEIRGDPGTAPGLVSYTATPLSVRGYTAIHRPMTEEEMNRLRKEQHRSTADRGFYVIDILPAESAFTRSVPRFPG